MCRYESNQHNLLPTSGTTGKSVEVSVSVEILWLSANAKTLLSGKHVFFSMYSPPGNSECLPCVSLRRVSMNNVTECVAQKDPEKSKTF